MTYPPRRQTARAIQIARKIAQLQHEAGEAGMPRTMHALHKANQVAGFEAAEVVASDLRARAASDKEQGS